MAIVTYRHGIKEIHRGHQMAFGCTVLTAQVPTAMTILLLKLEEENGVIITCIESVSPV
jgi:hypothetical protein